MTFDTTPWKWQGEDPCLTNSLLDYAPIFTVQNEWGKGLVILVETHILAFPENTVCVTTTLTFTLEANNYGVVLFAHPNNSATPP